MKFKLMYFTIVIV